MQNGSGEDQRIQLEAAYGSRSGRWSARCGLVCLFDVGAVLSLEGGGYFGAEAIGDVLYGGHAFAVALGGASGRQHHV